MILTVVYVATMSEFKIVDSIYFQFSFFFLFFFYFWELGLGFSVISPVMVTQQCHSHTVIQSCVMIEEGRRFQKDDIIQHCHMQVCPSGNYIPTVISSSNYTSLPSIVEILLFDLVFHDRVTPVSVSTLKPLLRVIGALPLKSQASSIISVCI